MKAFVFFILLLPCQVIAQITITGRILSHADTRPVENASVFLSNSTIGDKTGANGSFTLRNVTPGKYTLVVSFVGFDPFDQTITVGTASLNLHDILVYPKTIGLKEVTIKPDANRERNYQWFKEQFLGTSELAADCKILNPEILNLDYDEKTGTLTASSTDFLTLENNGLGYRIRYLLNDFSYQNKDNINGKVLYKGSVQVEEMKGTPGQLRRWQDNRRAVYENTEMHFLRSAIGGRMDDDGFRVLRYATYQNPDRPADSVINAKIDYCKHWKKEKDKRGDSLAYWQKKLKLPKIVHNLIRFPLQNSEIVMPTNKPGLFALGCDDDTLLISYNKSHHFITNPHLAYINTLRNNENTLICFKGKYVFFYNNGVIVNPYDVIFNGVWGRNRVAELLPSDYNPDAGADDIKMAADSTVFKTISNKWQTYSAKHIGEKTYLHFDKPYYAAGDTIYFKAYVTAGDSNKLSNISSVLHVDLVNIANKIKQSLLLRVLNGVACGDFALPDSLPQGNYQVRAYTRWMLNAGDNGYFSKTIPIGSAASEKSSEAIQAAPAANKPDVQFFPEGGNLVAGVRVKIAFKAVSSNGLGIDVKGEVMDNENNQLTAFASTHLGMGSFYLEPRRGKTYKASIVYPDGSTAIINLPVAQATGITLAVDNDSPKKMSVTISADTGYYLKNKDKDYTLIVQSAGVISPYIFKLDGPVVIIDVAKQVLYTGIATLSLFSATGEPLNERLAFIQNNDELAIDVKNDKLVYARREKTNLAINIKTNSGEPAIGHFSVAVIDESKVQFDDDAESTILTDLLLTSDLKGYVEQPNYYFTNESLKTIADMDMVMLTHGYRNFEWKQILSQQNQLSAYAPEKSLEIAGIVTSGRGKPLDEGAVSLLPLHGGAVHSMPLDKNGTFRFTGLAFPDLSFFVLKATNAKLKNQTVPVYTAERPLRVAANSSPLLTTDELDKMMTPYLANRKMQLSEILKYGSPRGILLKEVKVKDTKKDDDYRTSNLSGANNADQVIHDKDMQGLSGLFSDYFNGRLLGVTFRGDQGKLAYLTTPITLGGKALLGNPPMLLVVDGVKIPGQVMSPDAINLNDVETVEVLRNSSTGIYGAEGGAGVLIITTKQGANLPVNEHTAPGVLVIAPRGYYKAREFYSPKYDHPQTAFNRQDLRTTIYWNPEIMTDKDGNASFDYYNADGVGSYRVVIEGIDENGNLGRQVYRYKVE